MKLTFLLLAAVLVGTCRSCEDNEFECVEGNACIPANRVCDGYLDCLGGADEVNCPSTTTTRCPGFECNDGTCIREDWRCDGDEDCFEGEDEVNCPTTTKAPTTPCGGFVCNDGDCLPEGWECDGYDDCWDGEDEIGCPCDGFECDNGKCTREEWVCDGDNDCGDWSDESEEACSCDPDEIRCSTPPGSEAPGACIPPEWICDEDGIWDCPDGSDEANCTRSVKIPREGRFRPETVKAKQLHHIFKKQQKLELEAAHKYKGRSHKGKANKYKY